MLAGNTKIIATTDVQHRAAVVGVASSFLKFIFVYSICENEKSITVRLNHEEQRDRFTYNSANSLRIRFTEYDVNRE